MKKVKVKSIIFFSFIFLLFVPLIQKQIYIFKEKPLNGSYILAKKPDSIFQNWFSEEYQKQYEQYFNDHFGFRSFFVKINNQIDYSFFNISHADKVIVGKENYLFEKNYIKAYLGNDFLGEEMVIKNLKMLKNIHFSLKEKGKELILVLAPGKASFFPEYFPPQYDDSVKKTSYYDVLSKYLVEMNFNVIDFNKYFNDLKNTSEYPLYSKTGIHWSNYGMTLAFDSLIKYMEKLKQIDIPDINISSIDYIDGTKDTDYDIADAMNLLFRIPQYKLAYPNVTFSSKENTVKPKVIVIGDSYYFNFFNAYDKYVFSDGQFWYYFKTIYQNGKNNRDISEINIYNEIENTDFLIVLATELNLNWFPFGLTEKYFVGDDTAIIAIENEIKSNPDWLDFVTKQSKEKNISLDENIRMNAIYTLKMRMK